MKPPEPTLDNYLREFALLLVARALEGGELPVEKESEYVERLEYIWYRLSPEEQDLAEVLRKRAPDAPESLNLVDCEGFPHRVSSGT